MLELRERNDLVEPLPDVRPAQAVDRPIEKDVLSSREVGVEPRAELEQRADPALRPHPTGRGLDDPGDDTEQRRLARPVAPDETDGFAARDLHRHVMERPDVLGLAPSALDEQVLERARLPGVDVEPSRDAFDADLARAHTAT